MNHICDNKDRKPAIRTEIDPNDMERIVNGPLKETQGRGAASWVRGLIKAALDDWESVHTGKTQIDISRLNTE